MKTKTAFTLIELLIVVSIIIILISLLLPALKSAKEYSKVVACLNNIRQTYLGTAVYAGDFNGYAPFYKPWYDTAETASKYARPSTLSYGPQTSVSFRGMQMIENGYWRPMHLQCPSRDKFSEIGQCFAVNEYYKKKMVINPSGNETSLVTSYTLKVCAVEDWNSNALDPNANLRYRLGQKPGEPLLLDYYYYDYFQEAVTLHPRKMILVYEDGAGCSVSVRALNLISSASGSADRFMHIIDKLSRNYSGPITWK
jgi:hypothetical protein